MADAARGEPDEHLARLRLGEVDLLDDERLPELLEHGGADSHPAELSRRMRSGGRGFSLFPGLSFDKSRRPGLHSDLANSAILRALHAKWLYGWMTMPKAIQVRDVPDDVHATLRTRAAAAGLSLSDYLRLEITRLARKPTVADVIARARTRHGGASREEIVAAVRAGRDGTDEL